MTSISLQPADTRARLDFRAGAIVPRVIEQDASSARVALVAGGALLLGGDAVHIDIRVGAGCTLELEDIGGTVAYDADGLLSTWTVDVKVEARGVLIWHGLPLVVADGANVSRTTRIALGAAGRACLRETVVLGRVGEAGGLVRQRTDVAIEGRPAFVEELAVGGGIDVPGVIGANRVLDSVLTVGLRGVNAPPTVTVLELESAGSLARYLGMSTHLSPLDTVWASWSQRLRLPAPDAGLHEMPLYQGVTPA
ncbi:MAG: urease accessory protein [Actinomycetota bacterium]|jgi:urease accessory protein|nr:urease accessory protein [Actinomycetota bacterium]